MNNLVVVQKKEDRISKRKKKGKGQIMLAVEYPNIYRNRFILSTNRLIQTERYFCRGTTPVDTPIEIRMGSLTYCNSQEQQYQPFF